VPLNWVLIARFFYGPRWKLPSKKIHSGFVLIFDDADVMFVARSDCP